MSSAEEHYIVGYGSLMSAYSRRVYSQIHVDAVPVEVTGFERGWFTRYVDEGATYAGVQRHATGQLLGVLLPTVITPELRQRERGYHFVELDHDYLRFPHDPEAHKRLAAAKIWICENKEILAADDAAPVPQTYVDTCLTGAAETGIAGAMEAFIENTVGWPGPVIDDRTSPIYTRPAETTPEQREEIDRLLDQAGHLKHRIAG